MCAAVVDKGKVGACEPQWFTRVGICVPHGGGRRKGQVGLCVPQWFKGRGQVSTCVY